MKLLVIVICLLCERYMIHYLSYQRFSWFNVYSQKILAFASNSPVLKAPWLKLALIVLPLVASILIAYLIFNTILFGFGGFVFSLIVLYYCLGPQNIFYPLVTSDEPLSETNQVAQYFSSVNSQLFAVVFWYLVGGPAFAVAYRMISLCQSLEETKLCASQINDYLEWIPARIVMMLFLIVGNFQKAFVHYTTSFLKPPSFNNQLISECGLIALQSSDGEEISVPYAENFVEYAIVVFLVIIALFTLAAWI